MTPISPSGPHIVYYTLHFTFFLLQCYWEMWATFRHLEHSQKSLTKKVHNILLVGLAVRFVQISSIYMTSHWFQKVYWSWLRVKNRFHSKLPNEGGMRMFSLFSSFKTVGLIGAFYGPSLRPLPTFATLLTYEISKFIIYMSLSIPGYSSLPPGLFKWIWIPTFAIISFHPSPSTTLTKDPGVLPMMAHTERLRPKGVSFSGFSYLIIGN